jgi:hypothetical protein
LRKIVDYFEMFKFEGNYLSLDLRNLYLDLNKLNKKYFYLAFSSSAQNYLFITLKNVVIAIIKDRY